MKKNTSILLFYGLMVCCNGATADQDISRECMHALVKAEANFFPKDWFKDKTVGEIKCEVVENKVIVSFISNRFYGSMLHKITFEKATWKIMEIIPKRRIR